MNQGRVAGAAHRLQRAAAAIAPLLNRVVFSGREAADALVTDRTVLVRRATPVSSRVHLLTSSTLDRIGADLQRLGLRRGPRLPAGDHWMVDDQTVLDLSYVEETAGSAAPWLEYAMLLTMPLEMGEGHVARITGAPALLAVAWDAHVAAGSDCLDSEPLEDIITLVAGRPEIERELAVAVPELRTFVAVQTERFINDDTARHAIRASLLDAPRLPALVARTADRFRRLAALG